MGESRSTAAVPAAVSFALGPVKSSYTRLLMSADDDAFTWRHAAVQCVGHQRLWSREGVATLCSLVLLHAVIAVQHLLPAALLLLRHRAVVALALAEAERRLHIELPHAEATAYHQIPRLCGAHAEAQRRLPLLPPPEHLLRLMEPRVAAPLALEVALHLAAQAREQGLEFEEGQHGGAVGEVGLEEEGRGCR